MGTFTYPLEIIAADGSRSATVSTLVDTGCTYTCLPAPLLRELGIVPVERIRTELADGSVVEESVGEARVRVEGIERSTIVIFAGEDAPSLLGAYTLEGALLVVDPVRVFSTRAGIGFLAPPRTQTQQRQRTTQYPHLLRVARRGPRQSLQPPPILRMQPLIPVRQLPLAHDVSLRRQPAPVHPVVIAVISLRFRQPFVQPQKSLPTAVAHLKVHAPPAVRQLNHRRPNPHFLPLLPAPRPLISPHLVKRYGRHDTPSLALHGHPGPNAQGPPDFF